MGNRRLIKEMIKRMVYGKKYSSEKYIKYLRKIGMSIGEDVNIYVPTKTLIDEQYPWMISIGNHVRITEGVKILTHDYSWSVLKQKKGPILGAAGKVEIGNNVFIGMNGIICRNTKIGDNVIIGAGSVVTQDCESDNVYVGVPAKKIMSIKDYYIKRKEAQLREAVSLAKNYYKVYREMPKAEIFHEFFLLFASQKMINENRIFKNKVNLCNNKLETEKYISENRPMFESFEDFIIYCFKEKDLMKKEQEVSDV